jgi:hypothetical protein
VRAIIIRGGRYDSGGLSANRKRGSRKPRLAQHSTAPRFLQADFWPGTTSGLTVIRPQSASANGVVTARRTDIFPVRHDTPEMRPSEERHFCAIARYNNFTTMIKDYSLQTWSRGSVLGPKGAWQDC